jgi:hypothetical protein
VNKIQFSAFSLLALSFAVAPASADFFDATGSPQSFTVLTDGVYDIIATGAGGGGGLTTTGGADARIGGEFALTAGEV